MWDFYHDATSKTPCVFTCCVSVNMQYCRCASCSLFLQCISIVYHHTKVHQPLLLFLDVRRIKLPLSSWKEELIAPLDVQWLPFVYVLGWVFTVFLISLWPVVFRKENHHGVSLSDLVYLAQGCCFSEASLTESRLICVSRCYFSILFARTVYCLSTLYAVKLSQVVLVSGGVILNFAASM